MQRTSNAAITITASSYHHHSNDHSSYCGHSDHHHSNISSSFPNPSGMNETFRMTTTTTTMMMMMVYVSNGKLGGPGLHLTLQSQQWPCQWLKTQVYT